MDKLSRLVAASFSNLALLSSSVSTTNLRCLLVTTFSSLSFLSNLFSSPRFNHLRMAKRCFSWFLFLKIFSFSLVVFWLSFLLYLFRVVLSSAFLYSARPIHQNSGRSGIGKNMKQKMLLLKRKNRVSTYMYIYPCTQVAMSISTVLP